MTEEISDQTGFFATIFASPLNFALTSLCGFLIYKLFKLLHPTKREPQPETFKLPEPLPKHDMTLEELSQYNGLGPDKRVCIGILGKVYDCTKGHRFYGPGGPYAPLAGHDATRALAQFDVDAVKDEWDDVSNLTPSQMNSVQEWDEQFNERYDLVGKLVKTAAEARTAAEIAAEEDEEVKDDGGSKTEDGKVSSEKQN